MSVFYFGCKNQPGHFWWDARGVWAHSDGPVSPIARAFDWIDGGYAPRRWKTDRWQHRGLVANPARCFVTEGKTRDDRQRIQWDTEEYPQGVFLVHHKRAEPAGEMWSLMSWWDRCQGDERSACNSNIVARGELTSDALFDLLRDHFPFVVENLVKHNVVLRECEGTLA